MTEEGGQMRLNDIEMSMVIGRTPEGVTITVRDLIMALSTISGTTIGSAEFNEILSAPFTLHAPDTISNSRRYALLNAILEGKTASPDTFHITQETGEPGTVKIHVVTNTNPGAEISHALDQMLATHEKRLNP